MLQNSWAPVCNPEQPALDRISLHLSCWPEKDIRAPRWEWSPLGAKTGWTLVLCKGSWWSGFQMALTYQGTQMLTHLMNRLTAPRLWPNKERMWPPLKMGLSKRIGRYHRGISVLRAARKGRPQLEISMEIPPVYSSRSDCRMMSHRVSKSPPLGECSVWKAWACTHKKLGKCSSEWS